jgi:Arc/MetJ-type ribon-helix-helix transcriptional regulator
MNLSLPADLAGFVASKLKTGRYKNESDVVREALQQMQRADGFLSDTGVSQAYRGFASMAGADIEALAFLVLMDAAKSAEQDLQEIMNEVKAMTAAKGALRKLLSLVNRDVATNAGKSDGSKLDFSRGMGSEAAYHKAPVPYPDCEAKGLVKFVPTDLYPGKLRSVAVIQAVGQELRNRLDSMSELSEMTSLRLQMQMDRRSRFMDVLSNLMKNIGSTEKNIAQNLK